MTKRKNYFFLGLILVLFSALMTNSYTPAARSAAYQQQSEKRSQERDKRFIEKMIPHHEEAIRISEIARKKATHQEIKDLSNKIINEQTAEINQMKKMYKDWYGTDVPAPKKHNQADKHLQKLENSKNFDRTYLEQMIKHHKKAVKAAKKIEKQTKRLEMKDLAKKIIDSQTKEIRQMQAWKKQWK